MSLKPYTFGDVCQIGFKSVHENLEQLQQDLVPFKTLFERASRQAYEEKLVASYPDLDVIQSLFDKLERGIPDLLVACYHEPLSDSFWKEARHDLRACIGSIKSYAELIAEDFAETASQDFLKKIKKLGDNAHKFLPFIAKIVPEIPDDETQKEAKVIKMKTSSASKTIGSILIIDDDPQKRNVLRRHLEGMGHQVSEEPSGQDGLIRLKKDHFDLILLDIMMPEMSGHEVLDILKRTPKCADIPVLVISNLSELDSVVRCIDAGADDYLEMPVDPTLLNARVKSCLEKKLAADKEKKQARDLRQARNTLHAAIESIEDGFAIFDAQERLIMKNTIFSDMYPAVKALGGEGFTYTDFLKKNLSLKQYLVPKRVTDLKKFETGPHNREWLDIALTQFRQGGAPLEVPFRNGRWVETVTSLIDSGGAVILHKDITERKHREEEVQKRADSDGLTGLANRSFFEKSLKEAFQKSLDKGSAFAVMFFDLDGFKKVNDDFGHDFGDLVLIKVAKKLKQSFRRSDLVARLGGDEFCAIIYDIKDTFFLSEASERALKAIGTSIEKNGLEAKFGVSIGIAVFPGDANTPEELLSSADAAMYDAKKSGKGTFRFFSEL